MTSTTAVLIWDQEDEPRSVAGWTVLCWRSYVECESICSVPRYLEKNAAHIREKYLAFIHDLGEYRVSGKRLIDHLDLGDGFSFWWMTLLAEKSPFKSPRIYDCLRLIAMEQMLVEKHASRLTVVSSDKVLVRAIRQLCDSAGIAFNWQIQRRPRSTVSLRGLYNVLPSSVQGLLSLRHLFMQWPLRKLKGMKWFEEPDTTFICSYFIHLDPALCAQGYFHSRQWGRLPQFLHSFGIRTNWLQLFLRSAVVPDAALGLEWAREFNRDAYNQGCHGFLESYLSWKLVLKVLKNWLWLIGVSWRLRDIRSGFTLKGSAVWLWPLMHRDWSASLTGSVAMSNCLWIALFDAALADVPYQKIGLYLYENQAWEKALLRAWRRHGHGRIIGVQHSTAPFWCLPYAYYPSAPGNCALPMPDSVAVNGAAAAKIFVATGFPTEKLVEVEALRYLAFAKVGARGIPGLTTHSNAECLNANVPSVNVLILGEIAAISMDNLMNLVEQSIALLPEGFKFTFKSHPGYAVNLAGYPRLRAERTEEVLENILENYDVAIAGNTTSASVDAFLAGIPVIIGLHGDNLNLSPLRGRLGVQFVSTAKELADALQTAIVRGPVAESDRNDFFCLNPELPRWKRLLACEGN